MRRCPRYGRSPSAWSPSDARSSPWARSSRRCRRSSAETGAASIRAGWASSRRRSRTPQPALTGLVDEIHELGVQVKDLDRGLIDFPARHPEKGDIVLLCWELGEPEVAHWHDLEEGFAGRKPLPF